MGQSVQAILQLFTLALTITGILAWGAPRHPDRVVWALRLGCPIGVALFAWMFVRVKNRRENLPDLLAQAFGRGRYFERDGLCFAFRPVLTTDGRCWMQVYFQNRYERPCVARIVLRPPSRTFWIGRWPMQAIDVTVECDGAAFGVHRTPWPVPFKLQGRTAKFDTACRARYPQGRGRLLRFREGARTGVPGSDLGAAAMALGAAAVGSLYISRPARWRVRLPKGVADGVMPGAIASTEILWRPDLPTGGFPVLPIEPTPTVKPSPAGQSATGSTI